MNIQTDHTLLAALGMEVVTIETGRAVMTMPVDERTRQPFGFLHGGASVALAETAASIGAAAMIDLDTEVCFGLEINANHIKSKRDGIVTATALNVHRGKSTMVWSIEIKDENGELICLSRCTIAVKAKK
ncbi:hotdog fold thioesterase [Domibacillus sp. PGB-M46]|uniref:hotdog fold thioesterase n=1 Tax=Domibacillus sp. PGB-M46 TaxID=2910255 RepID=UPI001F590A86|nr:hotdog fold thioesterase [Domibacillus sp. PGB-M46]MCI2255096.1 hotdog fold thioesterase [Domibacillus sp. PGB-M46]